MLVELLADGDCPTGIGIDSRHARGRRWHDLAEDPLADPFAANDRGSGRAVRGDFEYDGLGHHPAADAVSGEGNAPHVASFHSWNAVVHSEPLVEIGEVRVDDVARRQILLQK